MNILIVDGNEKEASQNYRDYGMDTQYQVYSKILQKLSYNKLKTFVIHPAVEKEFLPHGLSLDNFQGIVWTGSLLNIYENSDSIKRQINLAKSLLNKKNYIFGSCWGLHVLVTAAGGKVRKNPNGLEAIIAKDISLNIDGINHPMYKGKSKIFDSFCWHYDEAESLPEKTTILSSNKKSKVQSISFKKNNSNVWAVQYHPEFNPIWMSGLMKQRENILLEQKVYKNKREFDSYKDYFSDRKKNKSINVSKTLINEKFHTLELFNWLNYIKNSN